MEEPNGVRPEETEPQPPKSPQSPDSQPPAEHVPPPAEHPQPAGKSPVDLYRGGNAKSPRLDNVRPGKEFTPGPNGEQILYPDQNPPNGLSTFSSQGSGKNWWELPEGSPLPEGLHFINDHDTHWALEPTRPMSVEEYINLVEQTLPFWIGPLPPII